MCFDAAATAEYSPISFSSCVFEEKNKLGVYSSFSFSPSLSSHPISISLLFFITRSPSCAVFFLLSVSSTRMTTQPRGMPNNNLKNGKPLDSTSYEVLFFSSPPFFPLLSPL